MLEGALTGLHRGDEINRKTPDVECEDERHDPLAYSSTIVVFLVPEHSKCDRNAQFDKYEYQLDPEGYAQDAVFAVVDSETLVLPADENCRDDVPTTVQD